jgi:TP901 family phage tail tape measure protein
MAIALVNLKFGVNVQEFKSQLDKVQSEATKMGNQMKAIGQNLSMYVTAPLAGIAAVSVKMSADFDDAMRKVQATSGASGAQFDMLKKKALEMGSSTRFTAAQSAEAMNYMAMAGWKTTDIMSGLNGIMMAAAASGEELGLVSDIVTDGLTAFGLSAKDSDAFVDVLAATASNANTNIKMLGDSFRYAAPVAGALGFSVQDTALALGLMANSGIKAEQAGTAMRAIFSRLVKPTAESQEAMTALGISIVNADGTLRPLASVLTDLRGRFAGLPPAQQAMYAGMLAGQEAMSGMLALVNASETDFQKLSGAITNSAGVAQRMADTMEGGLGGAFRSLRSAVEGAMIQIGDLMAPVVMRFADLLKGLVNWFSQLSDGVKTAIIVVGALAAAAGPLLVVLGTLVTVIIPAMKAGIAAVTMVASPLILKVIAISAAVAALVVVGKAVIDSWSTIKEFFGQVWDGIKLKFINGVKETLKVFNKFTSIIGLDFSETIQKLNDDAAKLSTKALMTPAVTIGDVFSEIGTNIKKTFTGATDSIKEAGNAMNQVLSGTGESSITSIAIPGAGGASGTARTKDAGIAPPSMGVPSGALALPETIKGISKELPNKFKDIMSQMQQFNNDVNGLVTGTISNTFANLGSAIGNALATGQNAFAAAGQVILSGMADFLGTMGKMLIQMGTMAIVKAKLEASMMVPGAGFITGPMAIAAGVALLGLSAALGSFASGKGGGRSSSGGGALGPASSTPARAGGGIVQGGQAYLVGERGPELFMSGMGGSIVPNHKLGAMGGGGAQTIHIVGEFKANGRELVSTINEYVRQSGRTT